MKFYVKASKRALGHHLIPTEYRWEYRVGLVTDDCPYSEPDFWQQEFLIDIILEEGFNKNKFKSLVSDVLNTHYQERLPKEDDLDYLIATRIKETKLYQEPFCRYDLAGPSY